MCISWHIALADSVFADNEINSEVSLPLATLAAVEDIDKTMNYVQIPTILFFFFYFFLYSVSDLKIT